MKAEYAGLAEQKKSMYVEYGKLKKKMLEWQAARTNIERILRQPEDLPEKETWREQER